MIDELRLALPSKGELEEDTTKFMAACGLRVDRTNPRTEDGFIDLRTIKSRATSSSTRSS